MGLLTKPLEYETRLTLSSIKTMLRRYFLWYFILFVAGCTAATNNQRSNNNSLLKDQDKLLFAVSDVQGLEELQGDYGQFRTAWEEVLETKIEFFPVDNFLEVATALQLALVDLVLAGPSEYTLVRARTNSMPIVALTGPNYRAAIAVRGDSGLKSLADLKGKTIELGNVGSTGSYSDVLLHQIKDYDVGFPTSRTRVFCFKGSTTT
ncbi:MAG: PhnD/SsuA/transferrin family substrate-binding protein [Okeania sp. SIO2F4]|uniref:phosphate/phosphite/phosphonate ABC transporter substrate-binding protein n=1 Tax=Okeania sp. SIO2F4 TaxID=2607790 RepID=UPI00142C2B98|nr:PhnD/SsuA/transferrin family substrate-binding protein [Okeania sp. SIO2F4]NES07226.1 PhnD/SsuA/transferrin family substrate-binding protein [Okeania sp. SIO2F4]